MNKEILLQKPNRFGLFVVIAKDVERTLAIRTRLGEEIHIQQAYTFLYPLVGRKVSKKDISPSKPTSKCSKNVFEIFGNEGGRTFTTNLPDDLCHTNE